MVFAPHLAEGFFRLGRLSRVYWYEIFFIPVYVFFYLNHEYFSAFCNAWESVQFLRNPVWIFNSDGCYMWISDQIQCAGVESKSSYAVSPAFIFHMLPEIIQKDLLFFEISRSHIWLSFCLWRNVFIRTPSIPNHFMVVGSGKSCYFCAVYFHIPLTVSERR